jgi:hypothetical protein
MNYEKLTKTDIKNYEIKLKKYLTLNKSFIVHNPDALLLTKNENGYIPTIIYENGNMKLLWISKDSIKITEFDSNTMHPYETQADIFETNPKYILNSLN